MTKLGTPIGAGPKGAIVVVGLARVGAPPSLNGEPPFAFVFLQRLVAAAGRARRLHRAAARAAAAGVAEAFVVGDAAADFGLVAAADRFAVLEAAGLPFALLALALFLCRLSFAAFFTAFGGGRGRSAWSGCSALRRRAA